MKSEVHETPACLRAAAAGATFMTKDSGSDGTLRPWCKTSMTIRRAGDRGRDFPLRAPSMAGVL
jgi:hypothetical protein